MSRWTSLTGRPESDLAFQSNLLPRASTDV